jgi:hypothetical protein
MTNRQATKKPNRMPSSWPRSAMGVYGGYVVILTRASDTRPDRDGNQRREEVEKERKQDKA